MQKLAVLVCAVFMSVSMLSGCGESSSSSHTTNGYYGTYNPSQGTGEVDPSHNQNQGDSSNPVITGTSDIILDSGNYDSACFSITGKGFGNYYTNGFVTMTPISGHANIQYGVKTWSGDAVNVVVTGLSTPAEATFSLSLTTNDGATVTCPNVVIKSDGIDDNISPGNQGKLLGIFAGSTADSVLAPYCKKDALDMYNSISVNGNFGVGHVALLNENKTSDDVRQYMSEMIGHAQANDTFLFYYSGHGNENYLAMDYTSGGIRASEIENYLKQFPADCHKILLIDSCSSGTFLPKDLNPEVEKSFKELSSTIPNLAVMAACGPKNDSGTSTRLNQSEFTYALLEGLGRTSKTSPLGNPVSLNVLFNSTLDKTHYTDQDDMYGYSYPVFKKTGNDFYIK